MYTIRGGVETDSFVLRYPGALKASCNGRRP